MIQTTQLSPFLLQHFFNCYSLLVNNCYRRQYRNIQCYSHSGRDVKCGVHGLSVYRRVRPNQDSLLTSHHATGRCRRPSTVAGSGSRPALKTICNVNFRPLYYNSDKLNTGTSVVASESLDVK